MNVLFVCSRNKMRSRTAEKVFSKRQDINVKSAGFSNQSPVKLSNQLVLWADLILVMEYKHSKRLLELFRNLELPSIEVLNIPDEYKFMDTELITFLEDEAEEHIQKYLNLL